MAWTGATAWSGAGAWADEGAGTPGTLDRGELALWRRLAVQPDMGLQAAVNAYCGTSGASIIRALNTKLGRTNQDQWRSIVACLRELASKPDLDQGGATANIPG